jgi:hypothetical protein
MTHDLSQDLRICLRGLLRAPIFALVIVTTVGIGIGATTTVFTAVQAALLRPLPYATPDRLVRIFTDSPPNRFPFSVADYLALTAGQTQFDRIAGSATRTMTFTDGVVAERVRGRAVSPEYFEVLGIQPSLGRGLTGEDGRPVVPAWSLSAMHCNSAGSPAAPTPSANLYASTAWSTPSSAFSRPPSARWSRIRTSSLPCNGRRLGGRARSSSPCSDAFATVWIAAPRPRSCTASTAAFFQSGAPPIRTIARHGT